MKAGRVGRGCDAEALESQPRLQFYVAVSCSGIRASAGKWAERIQRDRFSKQRRTKIPDRRAWIHIV